MTAQCSRCHTPCSSTDLDCPHCGAAIPRPAAALGGRAVILGPAVRAALGTATTVTTGGTRPARLPPLRRSRRSRLLPVAAGPLVTGTVTGQVEQDRHAFVGWRVAATSATAAAAASVLALAFVGGFAPSQSLVLLLALGGVLVAARAVSIALVITGGENALGAYERRRCTFVVTEPSGTRTTCHLTGDPVGDPPRRGDVVEVYGRTRHDGAVRIREFVRIEDRTVTSARPSPAAAAALIADAAAVLVILTCVVAGIALLAGGPS